MRDELARMWNLYRGELAKQYCSQPRIMLAEEPKLTELDFLCDQGDVLRLRALGARL
jgi:hypothetical protein